MRLCETLEMTGAGSRWNAPIPSATESACAGAAAFIAGPDKRRTKKKAEMRMRKFVLSLITSSHNANNFQILTD
jgi:hypothetical protein